MNATEIRRIGRYIRLGDGLTAIEGNDGLPTLEIRHHGRKRKYYRGSSLVFSSRLTDEDKRYLASLAAKAAR